MATWARTAGSEGSQHPARGTRNGQTQIHVHLARERVGSEEMSAIGKSLQSQKPTSSSKSNRTGLFLFVGWLGS